MVHTRGNSMKTVMSKDGTAIAFDQSSQGPALILVASASATRKDQVSLAAALAPHFTVLAYDRRGRGESGDTAPYAALREIEDLDALITEAGGAAFVFGHSSGAVLALEAARRLPGKIAKLALYEPPFIIDDSHPPLPQDAAAYLTGLVSAGRRGEAVEYFMRQLGLPAEMIAQMRHSPIWRIASRKSSILRFKHLFSSNAVLVSPLRPHLRSSTLEWEKHMAYVREKEEDSL
jgi:pimeloyl-ACP methyl ester carboxylesterase